MDLTVEDREIIVNAAKLLVGKPYQWGGTGPVRFDCTGLVQFCYGIAGIELDHPTVDELWEDHCDKLVLSEPLPGDLFFIYRYSPIFGEQRIDHVGILVGSYQEPTTTIVHASREKGCIVEDRLTGNVLPSTYGWNKVGRLKLPHIPKKRVDIRKSTLLQFTGHPRFEEVFSKVMEEASSIIKWECESYGDNMAQDGLGPWVVHCRRKGGRLFNRLFKENPGRDSFRHDMEDLLRYAIYTNVYYRLLNGEVESSD